MSSLGLLLRSIEKGVFSGTALVFRCLEIRDNLSLGGASLTSGAHRNRVQRRSERCGATEASLTVMTECDGGGNRELVRAAWNVPAGGRVDGRGRELIEVGCRGGGELIGRGLAN